MNYHTGKLYCGDGTLMYKHHVLFKWNVNSLFKIFGRTCHVRTHGNILRNTTSE